MAEKAAARKGLLPWAGILTGVIGLVFSIFSWTSVTIPASSLGPAFDSWNSAWSSGFTAWASVLLLVISAVLAFLQLPRPNAPLAITWLVLSGVSVLLILFRWFTADSVIADQIKVPSDKFDQLVRLAGASSGAGIALFITLIVAVVSTAAAYLRLRQSRA